MIGKRNPVGASERDFKFDDCIGSGGSAKVYKAECLQDGFKGKYVAIKKIPKFCKKCRSSTGRSKRDIEMHSQHRSIDKNSKFSKNCHNCTERINKEIEIHSELQHPCIVKYRGSFQNKEYCYIVLELCERGSLQEYIKKRHREKDPLSEKEACNLIKQVIEGVQCLHMKNIIHRDLSLRNLLLTKNNEVKIADFGLAIRLNDKRKKTTFAGTFNFMAPEAFRGYYDFKTDCWSVGCVLYALLYGAPPFECIKNNCGKTEDKKKRIERHINESDLSFPDNASKEAKELLGDMLQKDANTRVEIKGILTKYAFFQKYEESNKAFKANYHKNGDSGINSFSSSASLNSYSRRSARNFKYNETVTNDEHCDSYMTSQNQWGGNFRSEEKRKGSSSQLAKRKDVSTSKNQFKNKMKSLPQISYVPILSSQINSDVREYNTFREPKEINSQTHSSKFEPVNTSTKIQDNEQKCFPYSHEYCIEQKNAQMKNFQGKTLENTLIPLNAWRLRSIRSHFRKDAVISIMNYDMEGGPKDGSSLRKDKMEVCLEFFELNKDKKHISLVFFISRDGEKICLFHPERKIRLSDKPLLPDRNKGKIQLFDLENLPKNYWKRYNIAKHFVDFIRARTPKIILYVTVAKCEMMENSDFKMKFYDGHQITEIGGRISIKDKNGDVAENCSNAHEMLYVFAYMKKACKKCEDILNSQQDSIFPEVKRSPDGLMLEYQDVNKGNTSPICIPPLSLNASVTAMKKSCENAVHLINSLKKPVFPKILGSREDFKLQCQNFNKENTSPKCGYPSSLNGTVTTMQSFDVLKFTTSTPSHNFSQKSIQNSQLHEKSSSTSFRTTTDIHPDFNCQLADENWVVARYKDGIELWISMNDDEYFFSDVNTKQCIPCDQLDLINRYQRDRFSILGQAFHMNRSKR